MSVNTVKYMFRMFEKTGFLHVAPRRGRHATDPVIVEEVVIATAEATANSSNATLTP